MDLSTGRTFEAPLGTARAARIELRPGRARVTVRAEALEEPLVAVLEKGVERRMVAEERLDGVEALRNPGVEPVLAQMIVDPMCPVVHVEAIIGR